MSAYKFESFISSSRIVAGNVLCIVLRVLATSLDLLANFIKSLSSTFVHVYDFMIIIPLRIEQKLTTRRAPKQRSHRRENARRENDRHEKDRHENDRHENQPAGV